MKRRLVAIGIVAALGASACGADQDESAIEASTDSAAEFDSAGSEELQSADGDAPVDLREQPGRDIIHNISMTVQTSDVGETASEVRQLVIDNGGFVGASEVSIEDPRDDGSVPGNGRIVVRMDPADVGDFVTALDGTGFVTRLSQDAQDVTEQLVDLDIRIRQAETSVERIETLLAEATDLENVFVIERELTQRQTVLEQLRAQERTTGDLVDLATVTIQIQYRSPAAIEDATDGSEGLVDGLRTGWDAFVGAVFVLGYVLAVAAPFLLVALLVLAVALRLGRRWNARSQARREERRIAADRPGVSVTPFLTDQPNRQPPPPPPVPQPSRSSSSSESASEGGVATDVEQPND